jgi:hypothetical protein
LCKHGSAVTFELIRHRPPCLLKMAAVTSLKWRFL